MVPIAPSITTMRCASCSTRAAMRGPKGPVLMIPVYQEAFRVRSGQGSSPSWDRRRFDGSGGRRRLRFDGRGGGGLAGRRRRPVLEGGLPVRDSDDGGPSVL